MATIKRLSNSQDNIVNIEIPVSEEEIKARDSDYPIMGDTAFGTKYKDMLFRPVSFTMKGNKYQIQMNFCTNHYCKWFNKPQMKFEKVVNKPSIYKLVSGNDRSKSIACNNDPTGDINGISLNCYSKTLSNWSIAEEIKRLSINDAVQNMVNNNEYIFHKEDCSNKDKSPFTEPSEFYKRGKSSSNSQKWQCKSCKKITNVLPSRANCSNYNQKKNDILPLFAKLLISRTPVKRTCSILNITPSTYYNKLEWLYKRCIEFNERHECKWQVLSMKFRKIISLNKSQLIITNYSVVNN